MKEYARQRELVRTQLTDVVISVAVVTSVSILALAVGYIMGASQQQREWSMLYGITFIGSISSFFCLIKLSRFSRLLSAGHSEVTKKDNP